MLFIKGNNVLTKKSIGNFAVLRHPRAWCIKSNIDMLIKCFLPQKKMGSKLICVHVHECCRNSVCLLLYFYIIIYLAPLLMIKHIDKSCFMLPLLMKCKTGVNVKTRI